MKFYTSDPHFFHTNSIRNSNRPFKSIEEMDETLIKNWNRKVKKNDEVYIVGDFTLSTDIEKITKLLTRLNGKKYLIEGNHDRFQRKKAFDRNLFESITPYLKIKDGEDIIILSHYPILVWDRKHYGTYHYYGHMHNKDMTMFPQMENSYNVGVDVNNFEPVTHKEIQDKMNRHKKGLKQSLKSVNLRFDDTNIILSDEYTSGQLHYLLKTEDVRTTCNQIKVNLGIDYIKGSYRLIDIKEGDNYLDNIRSVYEQMSKRISLSGYRGENSYGGAYSDYYSSSLELQGRIILVLNNPSQYFLDELSEIEELISIHDNSHLVAMNIIILTDKALELPFNMNKIIDIGKNGPTDNEERRLEPGMIVKHFKDNYYKVLGLSTHVEGGRIVNYKSVLEPDKIWSRDYDEFMSEVDRSKYPNVNQKYRFEIVTSTGNKTE